MDGSLGFLFAAYLLVGMALLLYYFGLSGRLEHLKREIEALRGGEAHRDRGED